MRKVYFISDGSRIKIGSSKNVADRLRNIETLLGLKLELLGVINGGFNVEGAFHRALKAHRLAGEWFADCPEVRSMMMQVALNGNASEVVASRKRARGSSLGNAIKVQFNASEVFNSLWSEGASENLQNLTGARLRSCQGWVSGANDPKAYVLRNILRTERGFDLLSLMLDGRGVQWWEEFKQSPIDEAA